MSEVLLKSLLVRTYPQYVAEESPGDLSQDEWENTKLVATRHKAIFDYEWANNACLRLKRRGRSSPRKM